MPFANGVNKSKGNCESDILEKKPQPKSEGVPTIFAVFGRGEKLELVSKKSEDEMNISAGLAKKEKKLQA